MMVGCSITTSCILCCLYLYQLYTMMSIHISNVYLRAYVKKKVDSMSAPRSQKKIRDKKGQSNAPHRFPLPTAELCPALPTKTPSPSTFPAMAPRHPRRRNDRPQRSSPPPPPLMPPVVPNLQMRPLDAPPTYAAFYAVLIISRLLLLNPDQTLIGYCCWWLWLKTLLGISACTSTNGHSKPWTLPTAIHPWSVEQSCCWPQASTVSKVCALS
jgi:hypothetical protein